MQSSLEQNAINEAARKISPLQQQLLQSLRDKGPGLLLEMAVRAQLFPEDVNEPLSGLVGLGLATTQSVSTSKFGAELFVLAPAGDKVLRLLSDPAFQREITAPPPVTSAKMPDTRQSEAELHTKLGDALQQQGNIEKAIEHYQRALELTRELSTGSGESR